MKPLSEESLKYLSEQKFETEKSNKFTPKVLRDKMIGKFRSLDKEDDKILVVESFEFCEDFKNLGFKNISFMSDNLDKNKFVEGIYGFETFLLNLKETKNIKFEMKFDKVIMNPPYGKLHLPILKKCVEEFVDIENGGEIVSLQPVRWLQDPLAKYKKNSDALKMQSCLEGRIVCIQEFGAKDLLYNYFGIPFTFSLGIFHIIKGGSDKYFNENPIIEKIMKYEKRIADYIEHDKIDGYRSVLNNICPSFTNRPQNGKGYYRNNYSNNGLTNDGKNWDSFYKNKGYVSKELRNIPHSIKFNTETELNNFIESTKTKFFRYLVYKIHIDMSVPNKYLPFMEDYTEPWTDERFYEYFNITPEEQQIIEEALKEDE